MARAMPMARPSRPVTRATPGQLALRVFSLCMSMFFSSSATVSPSEGVNELLTPRWKQENKHCHIDEQRSDHAPSWPGIEPGYYGHDGDDCCILSFSNHQSTFMEWS